MNRKIVVLAAAIGLSCAGPSSSGPPVRPASSAEHEVGYQEAISLGAELAGRLEPAPPELLAVESLGPNIWCVRFGLSPKGSGRVLEVHVDSLQRQVLRSAEVTHPVAHLHTADPH